MFGQLLAEILYETKQRDCVSRAEQSGRVIRNRDLSQCDCWVDDKGQRCGGWKNVLLDLSSSYEIQLRSLLWISVDVLLLDCYYFHGKNLLFRYPSLHTAKFRNFHQSWSLVHALRSLFFFSKIKIAIFMFPRLFCYLYLAVLFKFGRNISFCINLVKFVGEKNLLLFIPLIGREARVP